MTDVRFSLRRWKWPAVFLAPFLVCFCLFGLYPIVYSFHTSLFDWNGINEKVFVGLDNYRRILTSDANFRKSLINTVRIMLMGFPASICLGLLIAVFLSNLSRGRVAFQTVNFLPYITTPVAIGLIFTFLFDWNTGIVNRINAQLGGGKLNWLGQPNLAQVVIAVMIIWKYTGYYMALYLSGISSVPEDIYEAADVDGASGLSKFRHITLPMLKPITVFIVITSLIGGLQLFDEPNLMFNVTTTNVIGGPDRSCLTIVWNFYDVAFNTNVRFGYGSAIAICLFLIIMVISLIGMRLMNRKEVRQ